MEIQEILKALEGDADEYPRAALEEAMIRKEEIVPPLLDVLERMVTSPEDYLYDPHSETFLPLFAITLLAHHQVREAHDLLAQLVSLPGELPFDLIGDAVHEYVPKALWKTSGGDVTRIKQVIEKQEANEYCRASAIHALVLGVGEGTLQRDDVVSYLEGLFTGEESNRDERMMWNAAASDLAKLWPGDSMDVIKKAFEDKLIEPFFINLEDFDGALERGKEGCLERVAAHAKKTLETTPADEFEHWASFSNETSASLIRELRDLVKQAVKKNTVKKKKRKQAKAARKKNRKRK